jgi:hypothetical protein
MRSLNKKKRLEQQSALRIFVIFMLVVSCPVLKAITITNRRDDVEMAVTTKIADDGKTLIDCVIYNQSPHPIATENLQTPSSVFYFKLLDQAGKEIQQDPEWAAMFAQKSSRRYSRPKSMRLDIIYPGEKLKFQFYLEDAYGAESSKGHKMAISWESRYSDGIIDTSAYKDAKGEQVLEGEKKYMFPPKWDIAVSLPLKEDAVEEPEKIEVSSSVSKPSDNNITSPSDLSSPKLKIDSVEKQILHQKSYFWWLLLIPLLFLGKHFVSLKK